MSNELIPPCLLPIHHKYGDTEEYVTTCAGVLREIGYTDTDSIFETIRLFSLNSGFDVPIIKKEWVAASKPMSCAAIKGLLGANICRMCAASKNYRNDHAELEFEFLAWCLRDYEFFSFVKQNTAVFTKKFFKNFYVSYMNLSASGAFVLVTDLYRRVNDILMTFSMTDYTFEDAACGICMEHRLRIENEVFNDILRNVNLTGSQTEEAKKSLHSILSYLFTGEIRDYNKVKGDVLEFADNLAKGVKKSVAVKATEGAVEPESSLLKPAEETGANDPISELKATAGAARRAIEERKQRLAEQTEKMANARASRGNITATPTTKDNTMDVLAEVILKEIPDRETDTEVLETYVTDNLIERLFVEREKVTSYARFIESKQDYADLDYYCLTEPGFNGEYYKFIPMELVYVDEEPMVCLYLKSRDKFYFMNAEAISTIRFMEFICKSKMYTPICFLPFYLGSYFTSFRRFFSISIAYYAHYSIHANVSCAGIIYDLLHYENVSKKPDLFYAMPKYFAMLASLEHLLTSKEKTITIENMKRASYFAPGLRLERYFTQEGTLFGLCLNEYKQLVNPYNLKPLPDFTKITLEVVGCNSTVYLKLLSRLIALANEEYYYSQLDYAPAGYLVDRNQIFFVTPTAKKNALLNAIHFDTLTILQELGVAHPVLSIGTK